MDSLSDEISNWINKNQLKYGGLYEDKYEIDNLIDEYSNNNYLNNDEENNNEYNTNNIMLGGEYQSYDEKNYDKGILRINITKDKNAQPKDYVFEYRYTKDNTLVKNKETLDRIISLKIPYVWDYVWISNDPKTPIQVIGHDKSGKKQYLYNKQHILESATKKFQNLTLLVQLMPKLQELINKHSKNKNYYDKKYILSTIIQIILLSGMRAGKEFHAKKSDTYGITSLRKKHVHIKDDKVIFNFKGKSNIMHYHEIKDPEIIKHIKELLKLCKNNDDKLFHYKKNGEIKKIDEFTLNNYLHKYLHPKIVIKDLRTYLVNYLLIKNILNECKKNKLNTLDNNKITDKLLKKITRNAIKETANFIQHTISVSKKNYIDPRIINKFINNHKYFISNINKRPSDILFEITQDKIIVDE